MFRGLFEDYRIFVRGREITFAITAFPKSVGVRLAVKCCQVILQYRGEEDILNRPQINCNNGRIALYGVSNIMAVGTETVVSTQSNADFALSRQPVD